MVELLTFTLGAEEYAIDILKVQEIRGIFFTAQIEREKFTHLAHFYDVSGLACHGNGLSVAAGSEFFPLALQILGKRRRLVARLGGQARSRMEATEAVEKSGEIINRENDTRIRK